MHTLPSLTHRPRPHTAQVHGETIMQHAELLEAAEKLQAALKPAWQRVEGLLQGVRCMVQYLGNLQG